MYMRWHRSWLAAVMLASPAAAGPFEDGLDLYERGDFVNALKLLNVAADAGSVGAQIHLGLMYAYGRGVERDYTEAIRYYGMAARQGDPQAFSMMGVMHEQGAGWRRNLTRAFMWYTLAAEKEPTRPRERDRDAFTTDHPPAAGRGN